MTLHEEALLAASTRLFDNGGVSEDGEMFAHEQVPVSSAPLSFRVAQRCHWIGTVHVGIRQLEGGGDV